MNVARFKAADLRPLFKRRGIVLLPELKETLGTQVDMTVFRKLKQLGYRTSYSHGGRYYALDEFAEFDAQGLWCRNGVWFSRYGTLLDTLVAFVNEADAGQFAEELRERLHVEVKESLLRLVKKDRVHREPWDRRYLYCAMDTVIRRGQLRKRRTESSIQTQSVPAGGTGRAAVSDELRAALMLFVGLLNEKQRRLYAGLEALRIGRGGDQEIADLLGLHPQTVAKGRHELLEQDIDEERVRRPGGGRKPVEKKRLS
jgi:hypothetical protein